jgi:peptidyl-dipeptidase A
MHAPRLRAPCCPVFAAALLSAGLLSTNCSSPDRAATPTHASAGAPSISDAEARALDFLAFYNASYQQVSRVAAETQWVSSTDVSDEHTAESVGANKAAAAFTGNAYVLSTGTELLEGDAQAAQSGAAGAAHRLSAGTRAQLLKVMLKASEAPGTIPDVVAQRIEAEGNQSKIQDGYTFQLRQADGSYKAVSANDIDHVLQKSRDLPERLEAWRAAKAIGKPLKPGLVNLQGLRNQVSRELGNADFFALQVADYGMQTPEMIELLDKLLVELRPLYEQLHCWAKHELAKRYGQPVPRRIPAHWLSNRWGQEWPGFVDAIDLDKYFVGRTPESIVQQAEQFYVSMGFPKLPTTFWERSSLYPLPVGSAKKKNSHASAWHIDLENDIRSLMSVEPNFQWFETTHHELGHIYYYTSYTRPGVPPILREGANRSFHEGIGELISLAASQQPYLREVGVLPAGTNIDPVQWQLNEALKSVVFMPWSIGVMSHWERDFYAGLPADEFNQRWWSYVAKYQGIEPPEPRSEEWCDAATKTHINDDPAQYYDYALATVLKFQLHEHIAKRILKQDPRACSYYGSRATGEYLRSILSKGATQDWREVLREATGEELSARAFLDYYAPLMDWLKKQNAGRDLAF